MEIKMNDEQNIFLGRLGKKPDLRYTQKSEPVCYLSVAINTEKQESAEWKRVIVWGRQAELCQLYLDKGKKVFVQGRINDRIYKDDKGIDRISKEVRATLIGFPNT
jgi:single-strand DNA-binding protein